MLPEDYVSNTSSTTSTPAIESNDQENNERNSAYETIQAKIRLQNTEKVFIDS